MGLAHARSVGAGERILALAPHIVETLYAVGAGEEIVGVVDFCDYPAQAGRLPRVGGYRGISVEAALRLRPSLAIAMDELVTGVGRLQAMGVRVEFSHPRSVEGVLDDILKLSALTGHAQEGEVVAEELRRRLETLRHRRVTPPLRVFYEIWHEPLITAGATSFISSALVEIGGQSVFSQVPIEGPRVSVESVLRADPQVIVIPGESRDVGERTRVWREHFPDPGVAIVEVDHDLLHRPGPRLFDGMEQLQRDLLRATGRPLEAR